MFGNPDDNNGQQQPQDAQAPAPGAPAMNTEQPTPGAPPAPAEPANQAQTTSYGSDDQPAEQTGEVGAAGPSTSDANGQDTDGLLNIKQQALQQLSPLVGHLDQTPEEEFRTTMMMIQAADDQALVQKAYEAAQKIEDEKTRARALLDIVNEINYFTQHHDSEDSPSSNEEQ